MLHFIQVAARTSVGIGPQSQSQSFTPNTPQPPVLCEAQSVGLVRYPATTAPNSGSTTVTAECADNAHRVSSSISVTCSSTGSWSGNPWCQCNSGYDEATIEGRQVCLG